MFVARSKDQLEMHMTWLIRLLMGLLQRIPSAIAMAMMLGSEDGWPGCH